MGNGPRSFLAQYTTLMGISLPADIDRIEGFAAERDVAGIRTVRVIDVSRASPVTGSSAGE